MTWHYNKKNSVHSQGSTTENNVKAEDQGYHGLCWGKKRLKHNQKRFREKRKKESKIVMQMLK